MATMSKQTTFLSFQPAKRTRRAEFPETMDKVVPWTEFVAIVAPHYEPAKTGRPLTDCEVLIRRMCLAVWFGRGDEMLEEDIHEMPVYRKFLGLGCGDARIPDHTVMRRFRNLIEAHGLTRTMFARINSLLGARGLILMQGTAVDATIIDAPSGTKNENKERTPGMASGKKGSNYRFGMKAHTGVDMDSGIVHSLVFTSANEADVSQTKRLTHGAETLIVGDKGCVSAALIEFYAKLNALYAVCQKAKRNETPEEKVARRAANALISSVRAIAEYPYRIVKWMWENDRTRFRTFSKNESWLTFAFTLANLCQVRGKLLTRPLLAVA